MHDPYTVIFEIKWAGIVLWHKDPEIGGDADSCGWFQKGRPWWRHPRWHVHHWRLQWRFMYRLKRFLWSRCEVCGKRFPWGYAPIVTQWGNPGPRWFRGEPNVRHHECR